MFHRYTDKFSCGPHSCAVVLLSLALASLFDGCLIPDVDRVAGITRSSLDRFGSKVERGRGGGLWALTTRVYNIVSSMSVVLDVTTHIPERLSRTSAALTHTYIYMYMLYVHVYMLYMHLTLYNIYIMYIKCIYI